MPGQGNGDTIVIHMDPEKETKLHDAARRVFDACPNDAHVDRFDNPEYVGCVIRWSMTGVGFGEITIAKNRGTGEWTVDDESMNADSVARILALAFPGFLVPGET